MTMNKQTKVLFILPSLHAGGTENYALRFIRFCRTSKFKFYILSPNLKKGDLHEKFEALGCTIFYQKISYFNPFNFIKLYKLLEYYNFDVIGTFNGNFGGIPISIARLAGVPKRIAWYRRSTNAFGTNPLKLIYNQMVNRLVYHNATDILSNSRFALNSFYNHYWENDTRFAIIPNGLHIDTYQQAISKLEARKLLGIKNDVFLIGHVGRFDPSKNHITIFKIAEALKDECPEIQFIFAGKGTDSPQFEDLLNNYNIYDKTMPFGLIENVPLLYKSLDMFIFPSITEGQPNALVEAMVSGIPVITSNIPPIQEILPESIKNSMPEPTDYVAFTKLIKILYKSYSEREKYICNSFAIKQFDGEINFKEFLHKLNE